MRLFEEPANPASVKAARISQGSPEYREIMLLLINNLEEIKAAYEKDDLIRCQDFIDAGYVHLEELPMDDADVRLVKTFYDKWQKRISSFT